MTASTVALRQATDADIGFLHAVYTDVRADELARVPWSDDEKRQFVAMQFQAQDRHYRGHYPDASFDIVTVDGQPAGRLYVNRGETIHVIDISLLAAYRGRGIGGHLLRSLQDEAARTKRAMTIHVERFNPARRLYERLGFTETDASDVYLLLEWRADGGD